MIIKTSNEKPWVILIHGLGVTENVWFAPLEVKVLFISFKTLLKEEKEIIPLAERCNKENYNIASWTQNIYGTVDDAAAELKVLVDSIDSQDIVFIAHSRGGLVARRAIQHHGLNPKALICLSTPHYGSGFADYTMKHQKFIQLVSPSVKRHIVPIRELCTYADLIKEINRPERLEMEKHVPHFDICGDSVSYFTTCFFNVMGSAEKLFGKGIIKEWKKGQGDGFVCVESCKSPLTPDEMFFKLPVNHANILIDNKAWDIVNSILQRCVAPRF
jgi:hypothetical protein